MKRRKKINLKTSPMTGGLQNISRKTVAAAVLVAVMLLLWGRVLLKGKAGPATANAQEIQQSQDQANTPTTQSTAAILPVSLEIVEGRHDVLTGDLFSTANWSEFDLYENPNTVSVQVPQTEDDLEKKHQANLEKIAKTLRLEAVIHDADGKPVQVFVHDTVLTVGSVLTIKEGPDQYELALKELRENEALFTWNNSSITVKMTETVDN